MQDHREGKRTLSFSAIWPAKIESASSEIGTSEPERQQIFITQRLEARHMIACLETINKDELPQYDICNLSKIKSKSVKSHKRQKIDSGNVTSQKNTSTRV